MMQMKERERSRKEQERQKRTEQFAEQMENRNQNFNFNGYTSNAVNNIASQSSTSYTATNSYYNSQYYKPTAAETIEKIWDS